MITKFMESLIEVSTRAFPKWEILAITISIVVISTFFLYFCFKEEMSIGGAVACQYVWFLPLIIIFLYDPSVPILTFLAYYDPVVPYPQNLNFLQTAEYSCGIILGQFLATLIYSLGLGLKKFYQVVSAKLLGFG